MIDEEHTLRQYNGLVIHFALRYRGRGLELEDLVQEGRIGLVKACRGFNSNYSVKFITYAGTAIRRALVDALQDRGSLVRVPPHRQRAGETPPRVLSLREGRESEEETIWSGRFADPGANVERRVMARERLRDGWAALTDREREVLWRIMMDGQSHAEAAQAMGVSLKSVQAYVQTARVKLRAVG